MDEPLAKGLIQIVHTHVVFFANFALYAVRFLFHTKGYRTLI